MKNEEAVSVRRPVSVTRILVLLFPAIVGLYGVYQAINQVLLPAQIVSINATNKVHDTAVASLVESIVGTVILPIGAAISDRTRSRFGKRTPWLMFSAIGTALMCVGMGMMTSIAMVIVFAGLVWFFANWFQGVIYAVIPDRIPEENRGVASSVTGLGLPFGILIFVNVVSRTGQHWGYVIIGAFILLASLLFCLFAPEAPSLDMPKPARKQHSSWSLNAVDRKSTRLNSSHRH